MADTAEQLMAKLEEMKTTSGHTVVDALDAVVTAATAAVAGVTPARQTRLDDEIFIVLTHTQELSMRLLQVLDPEAAAARLPPPLPILPAPATGAPVALAAAE